MTETSESLSKASDLCEMRLREEACRLIGQGKRYSVAEIAAKVGCTLDAIYKLQRGESWPGYGLAMRITRALGAAPARHIVSPVFISFDGSDPASHSEIHFEVTACGAAHAEAMLDGKIDHKEKIKLQRHYNRLKTAIAKYEASLAKLHEAA